MRVRVWPVLALGFFAAAGSMVLAAEPAKPAAAVMTKPYEAAVLPFVRRYCFDCHRGADAERGVQLDKYRTAAAVSDGRATWGKVLQMLRARKSRPRVDSPPKDEEYDTVIAWLEATLGHSPGPALLIRGGLRSGVSTVPSTRTRFVTCWASSSTLPPISLPTTWATGSTTSATCSRCRRC